MRGTLHALAILSLHGAAAGAQFVPANADAAQHPPAKPWVAKDPAEQGAAAMDRLRRSVDQRRSGAIAAGPADIPRPSDQLRRRAFDAMQHCTPASAMDARARAGIAAGQTSLARDRDAMAKRLAQALGLAAPDAADVARTVAPDSKTVWVPVLFVSSSMPVAILRTYAAQLERTGGILAFRGMPGGLARVQPMAKLSAEILRLDPGCDGPACAMRDVRLIVDPMIFRQQGIVRVPALTMLSGDPTRPYCERDDAPANPGLHVVYGDAALTGLLEEYARLGGAEEVRDAENRLGGR